MMSSTSMRRRRNSASLKRKLNLMIQRTQVKVESPLPDRL